MLVYSMSVSAPVTAHVALELVETRTLGSRVIHGRYARAR